MIAGLTIRNFRSISEIVDLPLRDFHVLVGPNGSGKSSFMDAIAFVRDCLVLGPVGAVAARNITDFNDLTWMRRGGAVEIGLWLSLSTTTPEPAQFVLHYTIAVLEPELEQWIWHCEPALAAHLKVTATELSAWGEAFARRGGTTVEAAKRDAPKELFEEIVKIRMKKPISPRDFEHIGRRASIPALLACPSFAAVVRALRSRFPSPR